MMVCRPRPCDRASPAKVVCPWVTRAKARQAGRSPIAAMWKARGRRSNADISLRPMRISWPRSDLMAAL